MRQGQDKREEGDRGEGGRERRRGGEGKAVEGREWEVKGDESWSHTTGLVNFKSIFDHGRWRKDVRETCCEGRKAERDRPPSEVNHSIFMIDGGEYHRY